MFAPILRLLAFFYLVYCFVYFCRSILGLAPQNRGPQPGGPFGRGQSTRPPPPFDDFGPFGPFGPFGQAQSRQQEQQRQYYQYQQQQQQQQYQGQRQRSAQASSPAEPSPYAVLGVSPGASADEIRRAYQNKVREYHPDRTGNLPQELKDLAEKRTKEITGAYNQLKRGR